jgi:hypothetical protein
MDRKELFRLAVFAIVLGFVIEFVMFSRQAKACDQDVLIIDGRVVVCSSCGGVMVCN